MFKMKTHLLLSLLLLLFLQFTAKLAETAEASTMTQFLEQRSGKSEDSSEWMDVFLPSNYYSELNEQYYSRFRRQSQLQFKDISRSRPYPFEIALYN